MLMYPEHLRPYTPEDRSNFLVSREAFEAWFKRYRPEVLVTHGAFVRKRLEELKISIPRDVAFVDIFLQEFEGRTAGVRHNSRRVGELAVEILVGQLHQHTYGVPPFATATLVEGTWFDGESLPSRVPVVAAIESIGPS